MSNKAGFDRCHMKKEYFSELLLKLQLPEKPIIYTNVYGTKSFKWANESIEIHTSVNPFTGNIAANNDEPDGVARFSCLGYVGIQTHGENAYSIIDEAVKYIKVHASFSDYVPRRDYI